MPFDIVVVGSINTDLSVLVERLPVRGETVSGGDLKRDGGGKGANQAVAAARLGRSVAMVGAVGQDPDGAERVAALAAEGIDVSGVARVAEPTGTAVITVEEGGGNTIVVAPGANRHVAVGVVGDAVANAAVVMVQYEVPDEVIRAAVRGARRAIVNPAPFRRVAGVLDHTEIVVLNETELAGLTEVDPEATLEAMAGAASDLGVPWVVVTLGERGALVVGGGEWEHVAAPVVDAVDTTAAGDAFCAGLADAVVGGAPVVEAVRWAVRVGAAATLRRGAQSSLPTRAEVEAL